MVHLMCLQSSAKSLRSFWMWRIGSASGWFYSRQPLVRASHRLNLNRNKRAQLWLMHAHVLQAQAQRFRHQTAQAQARADRCFGCSWCFDAGVIGAAECSLVFFALRVFESGRAEALGVGARPTNLTLLESLVPGRRQAQVEAKSVLDVPRVGEKLKERAIPFQGTTEPGRTVTVNGRAFPVDERGGFGGSIPVHGKTARIEIVSEGEGGDRSIIERTYETLNKVGS